MNVNDGKKSSAENACTWVYKNVRVLVEDIAKSFSMCTFYFTQVQWLNITRNMNNAYTILDGESAGGRLTYTTEMWVLKE